MKVLRKILGLPFTILYGLVMELRNFFFDKGWLKEQASPIPSIGVGNLSVGGTGKTPHVAYLVNLLQNQYRLATLSRGYGRKTKGFLLASQTSTSQEIGDEPCLYLKKFPEIQVAVSEKRVLGMEKLSELLPKPQVVLLDDVFQHRYLKPQTLILLTDYASPYYADFVFPSGNLRERPAGAKRADIIIVTKTPQDCGLQEREKILSKIKPKKHQKVFFSYIKYGKRVPLNKAAETMNPENIEKIIALAGIANPKPFFQYLATFAKEIVPLKFTDHHDFTEKDAEAIKKTFAETAGNPKAIFTTEKDAMRLQNIIKTFDNIPVFYIPIEVDFFERQIFNNLILSKLNFKIN